MIPKWRSFARRTCPLSETPNIFRIAEGFFIAAGVIILQPGVVAGAKTGRKIDEYFDYISALTGTVLDSQGNQHLHGDDCTEIGSVRVGATEFDCPTRQDEASGVRSKGANKYFNWFDKPEGVPFNRAGAEV